MSSSVLTYQSTGRLSRIGKWSLQYKTLVVSSLAYGPTYVNIGETTGAILRVSLGAVVPHMQFRFLCYPGKERTRDTAQKSNTAHVLASGLREGALSALSSVSFVS